MNPEQKKLLFMLCTLKLEESTSTLEIFPGTSTLEIFECTLRLRSAFKYSTSDFTGISESSSIKKARLQLAFSKALGLGIAGKVLSLVFELLRQILIM